VNDFRIVTAKAILRVFSISPVRGFLPISIVVVGEKLDRTTEVQYNGIQADEFVVATPSRLIVKVPPSQVGKPLKDLKVLSPVSLAKMDAVLSLGVPRPLSKVSGIDRLVQSWVLIFMTTPGSDIFSPTSGGGGSAIIGRSTDRNGKGVTADLSLAVEKTRQELLRLQAQNQTIPPSEKLLSSGLDRVEFDKQSTVLSARVNIQNMLGATAEVSVSQ
jgi:hypothetical protein